MPRKQSRQGASHPTRASSIENRKALPPIADIPRMPGNSNLAVARRFDAVAEDFDSISHPYTLRRRAEALSQLIVGRSVEFGAGTGAVTAELADRRKALVTDIAFNMCRVAARRLHCPAICCDAEAIPFADGTLDTVISSEMIYYLEQPERFADGAFRALRPGGRILISATNPLMTILERGRTFLRGLGLKRLTFFDDGSPAFLSVRTLREMLSAAGFVDVDARSIVPLPSERLDAINRRLERSIARRWGLFLIVTARKPGS